MRYTHDKPYPRRGLMTAVCTVGMYMVAAIIGYGTVLANSLPFDVSSKSAIVVDASTGEIIVGKNEEYIRPIASITKLMTAVVILDAQLPMNESVTITHDDAKHTTLRGRPYSTSLPVGTTLTRRELLHLALMNSHNRAAAALGRSYPGGMSAFVSAMNDKAQALGMYDTHFVEPTGLLSNNVSTAKDLAVLVHHAASYAEIQELSTSTKLVARIKNQEAAFGTTNRFLTQQGWVIGVQKTGYISRAGWCLVMITYVADSSFIVVLLNTQSAYDRAADAIKVKHWIETGTVVSSTDVRLLNPYQVQQKRHIKTQCKNKHAR